MVLFSPEIVVGNSDFIGGDFDNSTHNANGHYAGFNAIRRF
jgi:hypothetical protein